MMNGDFAHRDNDINMHQHSKQHQILTNGDLDSKCVLLGKKDWGTLGSITIMLHHEECL